MVKLEETYEYHQVQLPDTPGLTKCLLNADSHGTSTISLGSLLQYLATLTVKTFFLIPSLNLPCCSFVPFPRVVSLITREKRSAPPIISNSTCSVSAFSQLLFFCCCSFVCFLSTLFVS